MVNATRIHPGGAWLCASVFLALYAFLVQAGGAPAAGHVAAPARRPFPRVQVIVLPDDRASFRVDGAERLGILFAQRYVRPFWFPVVGPSGRFLTAMTHPHDPHGHRHHTSVWVGHHSFDGFNFWENETGTRIVHDRIERFNSGRTTATFTARNRWLTPAGRSILTDIRTTRYRALGANEGLVEITLKLQAIGEDVTFGKTPFGFLGVRVAKTMSVSDGEGTIVNSAGAVNEKGVLWQRARWVDYSGRVAEGVINGMTLMDHPSNPRYPTWYHVRNDGWMGTSFCLHDPYGLGKGKTLTLRYGIYLHARCTARQIDTQWRAFANRSSREPPR